MTDETANLVLEILRKMQGDMSILKHDVSELKSGIIDVRQDIHALKGDILRQERTMAVLEMRIERIENRLNLSDA